MTTQEIAARLVDLCRQNLYDQAQDELYATNAVSIEPPHAQGLQSVEGLGNIRKKGEAFQEMIEEVHSAYVSDPIVAGNHFTVGMGMDITMKGMGRSNMDEVAVYRVEDGKIVSEQFFF